MAMFSALNQALGARRSRLLLDNLTAYLFLAPAGLLILLFGIFPVAFAFFVSLHRWRRFPDTYVGLANYEKALGNLGYIVFFWLALLGFAAAAKMARRLLRTLRASNDDRRFASLPAGIVCGYAALLAIDWFFKLVPAIMLIPRQVRGQNTSLALFMEKLGESFSSPAVAAAGNLLLGGMIVTALVIALIAWRFRCPIERSVDRNQRDHHRAAHLGGIPASAHGPGIRSGHRRGARIGRVAANLVAVGFCQRRAGLDGGRLADLPPRHQDLRKQTFRPL